MTMPKVDAKFETITWCPRIVREHEGREFKLSDEKEKGEQHEEAMDPISEAINKELYRSSLKHDFYDKVSLTEGTQDDRLLLRSRRPLFKRIDKSLSLNFEGRVKKASRKNI
jgi:Tub family